MIKYKAIIYDLDGTLIDSKKDIALTANATLKHMNVAPIEENEIYKFVGGGVRALVEKTLLEAHAENVSKAEEFFANYYNQHCLDHTVLNDGAQKLIEKLHNENIKQAVFTNKPQGFSDKILKGLNVHHLFEIVLGMDAGFPFKPAPAGGFHILNKFGVEPHETLMIGDSHVDLETCLNVGMDCVLMLDGYSDRDDILTYKDETVCLCETFADLNRFLFNSIFE